MCFTATVYYINSYGVEEKDKIDYIHKIETITKIDGTEIIKLTRMETCTFCYKKEQLIKIVINNIGG